MTQHGEGMETDRRQAGLQVWNAARNIGHEESGSEAKFYAIIRACWCSDMMTFKAGFH